jgi:Cdc6-like AAA superfamily ATPase
MVSARLEAELLERDSELLVISESVARAAGGSPGTLFIEGLPGVGKTRLLQAAAEMAADEAVRALQARGGELERSFPFGLATQLLAPAVSGLQDDERRTVLAGTAALSVDRGPSRGS